LIIKQKLDLNYTLSFGKMTSWVIGLSEGKAIALKCSQCEKSFFPPQRICDCTSSKNEWIELSGKANILVKHLELMETSQLLNLKVLIILQLLDLRASRKMK